MHCIPAFRCAFGKIGGAVGHSRAMEQLEFVGPGDADRQHAVWMGGDIHKQPRLPEQDKLCRGQRLDGDDHKARK